MDQVYYAAIGAFAGAILGRLLGAGGGGADIRRVEHKLDRIAESLGIDLKPNLPKDVVMLAQSGNKIAAIKLLREGKPGLQLRDAKELVDQVG